MTDAISKIGSKKIFLSDVNSTINFAAKLIQEGLGEHGSVIMAENQTDGRGQQGSVWQSASGLNLLTSIILYADKMKFRSPIELNHFVSLSLVHFFGNRGIEAQIKWPNDILIEGKKIAGILIENKYAGAKWLNSIVGVGVNVNQIEFDLDKVTSMKIEKARDFDLKELLSELISSMIRIEGRSTEEYVQKEYLSHMFGYGETRNFQTDQGIISGEIRGVDAYGQLLVKVDDEIRKFQNKEIRFL